MRLKYREEMGGVGLRNESGGGIMVHALRGR